MMKLAATVAFFFVCASLVTASAIPFAPDVERAIKAVLGDRVDDIGVLSLRGSGVTPMPSSSRTMEALEEVFNDILDNSDDANPTTLTAEFEKQLSAFFGVDGFPVISFDEEMEGSFVSEFPDFKSLVAAFIGRLRRKFFTTTTTTTTSEFRSTTNPPTTTTEFRSTTNPPTTTTTTTSEFRSTTNPPTTTTTIAPTTTTTTTTGP